MSAATLNINETSKACGLSPSVLRIWELRYGWPSPKRKANGYRAYNHHQIDELKRVADLVKNGTPISALIIDGLPRWPTELAHRRLPAGLSKARALPKPHGVLETKLQQELVDALERRQTSQVKELLQRAFWSVRPDHEVLTALAPALIGLEELALGERPLAEDGEVRQLVKERCAQLLRRYRIERPDVWVVATSPADQALAVLATLILCQRGHRAQPWLDAAQTPAVGSLILAGDHQDAAHRSERRVIDRVSSLGTPEITSLTDLMQSPVHPVPVDSASTN